MLLPVKPRGDESREELLEMAEYNHDRFWTETHRLRTLFVCLKRDLRIERDDLAMAREISPEEYDETLVLNLMDQIQNCLDAVDEYAAKSEQ